MNTTNQCKPADALVIKKHRETLTIMSNGRIVSCRLCGSLRHSSQGSVTVGDYVSVREEGDSVLITGVQPRMNHFSRRAAGPKPVEQVIAANLDLVVAVFAAAKPKPRWAMLDRYLIEAEAAGIQSIICITKTDLVDPSSLREILGMYREIGYPVICTSTETDAGLDRLSSKLSGCISLLVGKSGVGKTTLINFLADRSHGRTREVSHVTGKGKHTTSEYEMTLLSQGGGVIDTPGAREFGLWNISPSRIPELFPEMRPLIEQCRFRGACTHAHEPECAVRKAVVDGRIDIRRYRSYLKLIGRFDCNTNFKHSANNQRNGTLPESDFTCAHCHQTVQSAAPGTAHRNHCPSCLHSRHVDIQPGDRSAGCGGVMDPSAVSIKPYPIDGLFR